MNINNGVSVLMLSYNHGKYIKKAIESVFLQKDYLDGLELIVIDDGSSDGTVEILNEMEKIAPINMHVIYNKHEGVTSIAKNFLRMIHMANNKYISFLASDDFYVSNRFEKQISYFIRNEQCQIIYANGRNVKDGTCLDLVVPPLEVGLLKALDSHGLLVHVKNGAPQIYIQSVLAKKKFLEKVIPFDCDLIADDWVFNIKVFDYICSNNVEFGYIDEPLFYRELLESSTSNNHYQHFNRMAGVAERYILYSNRKFYFRFYLGYIKAFLKRRDVISSWKISVRLFLLVIGSKRHNFSLSNLIEIRESSYP